MPGRCNQVRIIAGGWRGRRLTFPDVDGLRPTPDRIRETLFNWLAPRLSGARCLDLFAGSGALGFEAGSRGAARVVMVERGAKVVASLRANRERLAANAIEIVHQDAASYLRGAPESFDVVFLDPPFGDPDALPASVQRLTGAGWLGAGARIYVEMPVKMPLVGVPDSWVLLKDKRAGDVSFRLYSYRGQQ
jgi:16S rRNA (guanine966-N2)-methyltransferase